MAVILAFVFFFVAGALLVTAIIFLVEKKFKKSLMMLGLMLVSLILFIIAVMFTDIGTEATTEEGEKDVITGYGRVQGNYTYESTAGYTFTVPLIEAEMLE
ncbi:hypothetical protein QNH16_09045 [Peribacillus frigoritolerans]|uniref:hypothetical protein n=1 Tax=Peribacillus frigoritolerans TaxID=450367 RepID=UPI0024BF7308|nr:hypothetical protein [Peribacillus frigoritolerans]WHY15766.1 hypothetical protein QNH16_09045 [Peribacillus frigoritolerans]